MFDLDGRHFDATNLSIWADLDAISWEQTGKAVNCSGARVERIRHLSLVPACPGWRQRDRRAN